MIVDCGGGGAVKNSRGSEWGGEAEIQSEWRSDLAAKDVRNSNKIIINID